LGQAILFYTCSAIDGAMRGLLGCWSFWWEWVQWRKRTKARNLTEKWSFSHENGECGWPRIVRITSKWIWSNYVGPVLWAGRVPGDFRPEFLQAIVLSTALLLTSGFHAVLLGAWWRCVRSRMNAWDFRGFAVDKMWKNDK
jgi:hypothetical protein